MTACGQLRNLRRHAKHQRGRRQRRSAGGHVQPDALDRPQHTLADHADCRFEPDRLRSGRTVECFDASMGLVDRAPHRFVEPGLRGGEFGRIDLDRIQFAAVEAPRQGAQRIVAVGAHLGDDAADRDGQFLAARKRRPPQRRVTCGRIERAPFQHRQIESIGACVVHASIFSTGSTSSCRAPARFMSSRCCQVIAP